MRAYKICEIIQDLSNTQKLRIKLTYNLKPKKQPLLPGVRCKPSLTH